MGNKREFYCIIIIISLYATLPICQTVPIPIQDGCSQGFSIHLVEPVYENEKIILMATVEGLPNCNGSVSCNVFVNPHLPNSYSDNNNFPKFPLNSDVNGQCYAKGSTISNVEKNVTRIEVTCTIQSSMCTMEFDVQKTVGRATQFLETTTHPTQSLETTNQPAYTEQDIMTQESSGSSLSTSSKLDPSTNCENKFVDNDKPHVITMSIGTLAVIILVIALITLISTIYHKKIIQCLIKTFPNKEANNNEPATLKKFINIDNY